MSAIRNGNDDVIRLHSESDLRSYNDALSGHGPAHETVTEIDKNDDITSVRGILESSPTHRLILVVPSKVKVLSDGIEYKVLRRLQRELGIDLILVSDDLRRRLLARENGFRKVFTTLNAYYRDRHGIRPHDPEMQFADTDAHSPAFSVGRWGVSISVLAAGLLALAAYLALPVATVVAYPQAQTMVRDIQVNVEVGGPPFDITTQRLAGRIVQEKIKAENSVNVKDAAGAPPPPGRAPDGLQEGVNVTLNVRDSLRAKLLQDANVLARDRLKMQVKPNESLADAGIRTQVTGEQYDHNVGDVTDTLGGSIEMVASGVVFNNDDFNRLVSSLWNQEIPHSYSARGDLSLGPPSVLSSEGQHMVLRVRATGTLLKQVDVDAISNAVRGKPVKDAEASVYKVGDFGRTPQIILWPEWASRAYRVDVRMAVDGSATQPSGPATAGP